MRTSSQQLWTEAEALERAGRLQEALDLYVRSAGAEEDAGRHLRARLLWERIAERFGATASLLERLATASARARLREDAFDFWLAAAAAHGADGRDEDARRAREHAVRLKAKGVGEHTTQALAARALQGHEDLVRDLLQG